MDNKKVPAAFYPTTTVFLDDNASFLTNLCFDLNEQFTYQKFIAPTDALALIDSNLPHNFFSNCLSDDPNFEESPETHRAVNINIKPIAEHIKQTDRFAEVSTLVVDYDMPTMNGLEFCKKITNPNIKKIMLTGQAEDGIAIKAFNEGLIDHYINKSDPNLMQHLNQSLHELQIDYFNDKCKSLLNNLCVEQSCALKNSAYTQLVREYCRDQNIVEFYLIDTTGSLLCIDAKGNSSCLLAKNDEDMDMYYQVALDYEMDAAVLEKIKTGQVIPFFGKRNFWEIDADEWLQNFHAGTTITGNKPFYTAVVPKPNFIDTPFTHYDTYVNDAWLKQT
tara:strand:+ start:6696 stop:7697 length:1002 start_codon:yes stop_codon:yes gene_type:complete